MAQMTPPLHARGAFTVQTPYVVVGNAIYEVEAIRAYPDLIQLGVDIFTKYYAPVGLLQAAYQADLAAGANLITLISPTQPTLRIPDTYITSYPQATGVAYSEVVLSLSLGPIPDTVDLTAVKAAIGEAASSFLGLEPTVSVVVAPHVGVISADDAVILEAARQAAITARTTAAAQVVALQAQVTSLTAQNQTLTQLLQTAGVIPP